MKLKVCCYSFNHFIQRESVLLRKEYYGKDVEYELYFNYKNVCGDSEEVFFFCPFCGKKITEDLEGEDED